MVKISIDSGIPLKRISFSEAQAGKSSADRSIARLKNKIRYAIDLGRNVMNNEDLVNALAVGHELGFSAYACKLNGAEENRKTLKTNHFTIPGISNLIDFELGQNKLHMWRHYNIGKCCNYVCG